MRLTLRVLLAGLRAAEASFDEIAGALRIARTEINAFLDRMVDDGYGD